jgi:hypothetical protein
MTWISSDLARRAALVLSFAAGFGAPATAATLADYAPVPGGAQEVLPATISGDLLGFTASAGLWTLSFVSGSPTDAFKIGMIVDPVQGPMVSEIVTLVPRDESLGFDVYNGLFEVTRDNDPTFDWGTHVLIDLDTPSSFDQQGVAGTMTVSAAAPIDMTPIPLPAPALLLIGGLGALAALRRRSQVGA